MSATLPDLLLEPIVRAALEEDLGRGGDITSALLRPGERLRSRLVARQAGVVAGLQPARLACALVDPALGFTQKVLDGTPVEAGTEIALLEGRASSMLTAERTVLNFLTMMSGTASLTARFVAVVAHTPARIAATRKTLPGLRVVQKQAVVLGGGLPHRYGLDDAILIKDNHIAACGSVTEALTRARRLAGHMRRIAVEVDGLDQLDEALAHAPDVILLDNFAADGLREAVARVRARPGPHPVLEASGGVRLDTAAGLAEAGVDVLSVGALTHSAPALDIGLDA